MTSRLASVSYFAIWSVDHPELFFYAPNDVLSPAVKSRKLGLAKGVMDFARMMSTPDQPIHSVHSTNQRLIFLEPEADLVIHAAIELPRYSVTHKRAFSASAVPDKSTPSDEGIDDRIFLCTLQRAYEQFKLLNGSYAFLKAKQEDLQPPFGSFFLPWVKKWRLERANLAEIDIIEQLGVTQTSPDEKVQQELQKLTSHQDILAACVFQNRKLAASYSTISSDTYHVFTRFILEQIPDTSREPFISALAEKAPKSGQRATSESWKSAFGLSSFISMPSFTGTFSPQDAGSSISTPKLGSTPPITASPGSKSWTRVISLGLYGNATSSEDEKEIEAKLASELPVTPPTLEAHVNSDDIADAMDSDSDDSVAEHIVRLVKKNVEASAAAGEDRSLEHMPHPDTRIEQEKPTSRESLPLDPSDNDAQTDSAKTDTSMPLTIPQESTPVVNVEQSQNAEVLNATAIFLDESEQWAKAINISADSCTLALLFDANTPAQLEHAVIKAASASLREWAAGAASPTAEPPSIHRHLVHNKIDNTCQAFAWPEKVGSWSGSDASTKEADVAGCILDVHRNNLDTSEMFVRTQSGQWVVSAQTPSQQLTLVLGKKFGKEGSLVDADLVLRELLQRTEPLR